MERSNDIYYIELEFSLGKIFQTEIQGTKLLLLKE